MEEVGVAVEEAVDVGYSALLVAADVAAFGDDEAVLASVEDGLEILHGGVEFGGVTLTRLQR